VLHIVSGEKLACFGSARPLPSSLRCSWLICAALTGWRLL
jgi:hypothetical protein